MTTKNYKCWNCRFFVADDPERQIYGRCRRHAPHNLDFMGFAAFRDRIQFQAGYFSADIKIGGSCQMYRANGDPLVDMPIVPPNLGYNSNQSFPYTIPGGFYLERISWAASLLNVGTATVGAAPVLKLNLYQVQSGSFPLVDTIELPVLPAYVGIAGNVTDAFGNFNYQIPEPFQIPAGQFGWKLDLTDTDDNVIAEVRNVNFCLIASPLTEIDFDSAESIAKYARISDGTTMWCGEFKENNNTIPPEPIL